MILLHRLHLQTSLPDPTLLCHLTHITPLLIDIGNDTLPEHKTEEAATSIARVHWRGLICIELLQRVGRCPLPVLSHLPGILTLVIIAAIPEILLSFEIEALCQTLHLFRQHLAVAAKLVHHCFELLLLRLGLLIYIFVKGDMLRGLFIIELIQ